MPKHPTLNDVARAVGLAPATVSYALRGERGSADTVRRVREAAAELGYRIDPIASALASGRTGTVAVLCGSTRDLWQRTLATDLARAFMARGRRALLADADGDGERERELLDTLRSQRPDGIVVAALDPFAGHWEELAARVPVLAVGDRLPTAPSAGAVVFDNAAGFAQVFAHLKQLGHRRMTIVLPHRPSTPDRPAERLVAREAMRHGIEADLVRSPAATSDPDELVDWLHDRVLDRAPDHRATAVFCLTDTLAFAILRAARHAGLQVPADLSVVGFEDVEVADLVGPGLTTVDWDQRRLVDTSVERLLALVDGDRAAAAVHTVAPTLVVRGSTAPPSRT